MTIPPQLIQAGLQVGMGLLAQGKANEMNGQLQTAQDNLQEAIDNRPEITNPYAGVEAFQAEDLSDMISNPYANLRVSTKATEIQMEQTDQALANTLDTLAVGGMGAGGATALAQAAAQSKQGIAADIQQQEVNNEKLRAQGEMQVMQAKMAEQQRLQGIEQSEMVRVQNAQAAGEQFMFNALNERANVDLDRAQQELDLLLAQQQEYQSAAASNFGTAIGTGLGSASLNSDGDGWDWGNSSSNPQGNQQPIVINNITNP